MRKKIRLAWIKNDKARKQSYRKRKKGLVKKVEELTTLCGVNAFVVIHGPGDDMPTVWPSPEQTSLLIQRFRDVPEMQRCTKMLNLESYLRERLTKMKGQLQKLYRKNREKITASVMHEIAEGKPLSQFTMSELHSVVWLLREKMKEIKRRLAFYQQPKSHYNQPSITNVASISLPPPTMDEITGHHDFPWETLFGNAQGVQPINQNGYHFPVGSFSSSSSIVGAARACSSGTLQAYGDFFRIGKNNVENAVNTNVGFQSYKNKNSLGFCEGASNNNYVSANVVNEVGLGYGYFGGGNDTIVENNVGEMSASDPNLAQQVNFGGLPNNGGNQEMGIFGNAVESPNYGQNTGSSGENLGLGLQSSQRNMGGINNMNNYAVFQINQYANAGNDAGLRVLGHAQEVKNKGNNGVNRANNDFYGIQVDEDVTSQMCFQGSASNGNNGGNEDAEHNFDFGKFWPRLFY